MRKWYKKFWIWPPLVGVVASVSLFLWIQSKKWDLEGAIKMQMGRIGYLEEYEVSSIDFRGFDWGSMTSDSGVRTSGIWIRLHPRITNRSTGEPIGHVPYSNELRQNPSWTSIHIYYLYEYEDYDSY